MARNDYHSAGRGKAIFVETAFILGSSDGKYLAILREELVEIRSHDDNFEDVVYEFEVTKEPRAQWRKIVWNEEGTLLAISDSCGGILVATPTGVCVAMIEGRCSLRAVERGPQSCAVCGMAFVSASSAPTTASGDSVRQHSLPLLTVLMYNGTLDTYQLGQSNSHVHLHSISLLDYHPRGVGCMLYHSGLKLLLVGACPDMSSADETGSVSGWRLVDTAPYWVPMLGRQDKLKPKSLLSGVLHCRTADSDVRAVRVPCAVGTWEDGWSWNVGGWVELERGRMGGVGTWEDGWSWNVGGWVELERGRMGGVGTWEDGWSWNVGGWVELERGRMGGVGTWEDGWSWNVGGWVELERGRMGGVGTWEDGWSWNGGWVELERGRMGGVGTWGMGGVGTWEDGWSWNVGGWVELERGRMGGVGTWEDGWSWNVGGGGVGTWGGWVELERGRMGGVGTWEDGWSWNVEDGWSWNVGGWVELERGRMGGVGTWEDGWSWNVGGWVELERGGWVELERGRMGGVGTWEDGWSWNVGGWVELERGRMGAVAMMSLSPSGSLLAAVDLSGQLSMWDVPSLKMRKVWGPQDQCQWKGEEEEFTSFGTSKKKRKKCEF
eukprot:Em0009g247a